MNNSIDDHIERRLSKILQSKNYMNSYSNQLFKQKNNLRKLIEKSKTCVSDSGGSGRQYFEY